jgi:hypothetical protein
MAFLFLAQALRLFSIEGELAPNERRCLSNGAGASQRLTGKRR